MRTTLTLDDDVAARLVQLQRARRVSFKTVVNDMLRAGLDRAQPAKRSPPPFRTRPLDLGPSLVGSLDNIEEVVARSE